MFVVYTHSEEINTEKMIEELLGEFEDNHLNFCCEVEDHQNVLSNCKEETLKMVEEMINELKDKDWWNDIISKCTFSIVEFYAHAWKFYLGRTEPFRLAKLSWYTGTLIVVHINKLIEN